MTEEYSDSTSKIPDTALSLLIYIHVGRGYPNATTRRELCKRCGIEPTKTNQDRISQLREDVQHRYGEPIGICNDGYYIPRTLEGVFKALNYMLNKRDGWENITRKFLDGLGPLPTRQSSLQEFGVC